MVLNTGMRTETMNQHEIDKLLNGKNYATITKMERLKTEFNTYRIAWYTGIVVAAIMLVVAFTII